MSEELSVRKLNIDSSSSVKIGSGLVKGGVLGGGGCEKLNFRRVGEGGGVSCSNSCHD